MKVSLINVKKKTKIHALHLFPRGPVLSVYRTKI